MKLKQDPTEDKWRPRKKRVGGRYVAIIATLFVMVAMIGCAGLANKAYIYPDGCEGSGIINNLPEGTDKLTQIAIFVLATEDPKVRDDIINSLKDIRMALIVISEEDRTTTWLKKLILEELKNLNSAYVGFIAVELGDNINAIFSRPEFNVSNYLDDCSVHRLNYWIDKNLENLSLIND